MSNGTPASHGIDLLRQLALDVRWSWNHAADVVWKQLDTALWEQTHNPLGVLQSVSRDRIESLMQDAGFRQDVEALLAARRAAQSAPAWFQQVHGAEALSVAYLSMEFMLSEALPIYSGGLGNVAGDQLKAAGDLGVPIVGVGLLYQQGYFRQVIDSEGRQQAVFPYNDPGQLPVTPVRRANGEWVRFLLPLPDHPIWIRAWQVHVGRLRLYLLDTNDAANYPVYRGITGELYGGTPELRLQQELVLGIGGWRLLGLLGIAPDVCHLNEGHAAFAVLERAAQFMQGAAVPFDVALSGTRAGNLFTTHTAVPAGFDRFEPDLLTRYLGRYAIERLGISPQALLALGRRRQEGDGAAFSMAMLALNGSGAMNGVSRLHGVVSREIFAPAFDRWPLSEVPVGHITNGVHMPSWDSACSDAVWTQACGPRLWSDPSASGASGIGQLSDEALWRLRTENRSSLIAYSRSRLQQQLQASGTDDQDVDVLEPLLDPEALTIGFARRFAVYKRPNLLLQDPDRLLRILTRRDRPVQLILAGKAHPADLPGQELIADWLRFIRRSSARQHVIFLADSDMLLTERLVQGVDLWLNTPRRPWEACGTSGMKALVNGGLNLSELDGWWAEAYDPSVGWALGDSRTHADTAAWDRAEAAALYDLLEQDIIPEFYARDARNIPVCWVQRIRSSMRGLAPRFSSARTVRDYVEKFYLPCAYRYRARAADGARLARAQSEWIARLRRHWPGVAFGECTANTAADLHRVSAVLRLNGLDPDGVQVQWYADALDGGIPETHALVRSRGLFDSAGSCLYEIAIPAQRPIGHYTLRALPWRDDLSLPLELDCILWQH